MLAKKLNKTIKIVRTVTILDVNCRSDTSHDKTEQREVKKDMKYRKKMSKKGSRKNFKSGVVKTHKNNMVGRPLRGGGRL